MEKQIYSDYSRLTFEEFQKFSTPCELHDIASRCLYEIKQWIVESDLCSEATALMIFWNACPADFLNYSWNKKTGNDIDVFNIIRTVINNFEKGFYLKTDIKYDPSEVISKTKFIPEVVLQASKGEEPYIYIDKEEVHSWFGDYLVSKINRCDTTIELYNIAVSLKHREINVYEKILEHPLCDKAIALIIYWLLDKYSNSSLYATDWLIIKPVLEKIVHKLENNEYKEILAYDPNKEVKPIKWKIPDYMFKKIG
ncbi:DUF4274 domain-containing protein [Bacteroides sp. 224]|uniref:DUF4274 domain-containing protein n=1 Tax=Bacteroides sp. 224 TaxID=2302936 RepID=UPI0013D65167|nr:DUF4274 domain-containing protein [Bacteroides sp. 224]NDV64904.1 DUF4274 domain-containing protein [Bacteroides sp. 224]